MKLNVKAMAITTGVLWGGAMLLTALANLIWPPYGQACLEMMSSVYPGYKATASFYQVVVGTLYAIVDGGIGGAILAWLYNKFAG